MYRILKGIQSGAVLEIQYLTVGCFVLSLCFF